MKLRVLIGIFISWVLMSTVHVPATPIRLTVQPKGTNQVELTFGPVVPGIWYEVLARTNSPDGHWMTMAGYVGRSNKLISATCNLGGIAGLTLKSLKHWTFVAGRWDDPLGDELPPLYKELVLRIDPYAAGDPYGDPMGDGWNNLEKLQNNMDPYRAYPPPPPRARVAFYPGTNNVRYGHAVLTWQSANGPAPDYFLIERANRTPRLMTNRFRFRRPPFRANGRFPTNMPPNFRRLYGRPGWPRQETFVTGPYQVVAQCRGVPGLKEYRYIDPHVDTLFQPAYRIQPHYSPPLRAVLHRVDATEIRKTIISVPARVTTNGYDLTVPHPIPYACYLLLVRDKKDPQWRASGYFETGTNRAPVHLHVDKRGMMHEGQRPLAMPEVKFLPDVVDPEFLAGWGEDSDGDGLPDVYEVLVTHTDPDNTDTGNTGILDGYKEMSGDGWSNLEKFRRRSDPLKAFHPPAPVVLMQPTMAEAVRAMDLRTDLHYEPQLEVRIAGTSQFYKIRQAFWVLFNLSDPRDPDHVRGNFDLRISWIIPQPQPRMSEQERELAGWESIAFMAARKEFGRHPNPRMVPSAIHYAASRHDAEVYAATNKTFASAMEYVIAMLDGRQPEQLPEGVSLPDLTNAVHVVFPKADLGFDQPINFYGQVLDQSHHPVSDANVHFDWSGLLIHGRRSTNVMTDQNGMFYLTNQVGRELSVSVSKSHYYTMRRNNQLRSFQYVVSPANPRGKPFKPNPKAPVVYYLYKKGVGARTLITSQYGVYRDFSVKVPLDGTPVKVNLLKRKTGSGPLEISQVKPGYANFRKATNWSLSMKIPTGGFVSGGDKEFPFHPPESGYRPEVDFNFHKGQTNWSTAIQKDYYIRFGNPAIYGRLQVYTWISSDSVQLTYTINPYGSRNLEPRNENTPPAPPTPRPKTNVIQNNSAAATRSLASSRSNQTPAVIYRCVTIGGVHGVRGAADGTNGASRFNQPWGIAADENGSVYVAEWGNSTIRKLTLVHNDWVASIIAGMAGNEGSADGTNTNARLNHPHGIAVDKSGNLYVADTFNNTIREIRHIGRNWVVTTIAGRPGIFGSADGTNEEAEFNNPGGITCDRKGDLYVSDVQNNAIRKLTRLGSNWVVTTIAGHSGRVKDGHVSRPAYGSADGTNSDARFSGPFGIAVDSRGDLFVADYGNSTIRKITHSGTNWIVTTIAGVAEHSGYVDGTNNIARFDHPRAICIDKDDNIYVDDTGTDTIRLIRHIGTNYVVTTVVGKPWRWGYADGTNNIPQFNSASGIAVDGAGNIFLADTGNDTIREIIPPRFLENRSVMKIIWVATVVALIIAAFALSMLFRQKPVGEPRC